MDESDAEEKIPLNAIDDDAAPITNIYWSRKEKRDWFVLLIYGTCLVYAARTTLPLLVPDISEERDWSKTDSGTILSSFFWGYTLTQLVGGYISDRIGGHRVILFAGLGWSLTTFFMPEIIKALDKDNEASIQFVALNHMLNGALQGMHFPGMISLASQRLHESERASFYGLVSSGQAFGPLLTNSLGSYISENYDWMKVFQITGGLGLMWTGILSYYSFSLVQNGSSDESSTANALPWLRLFSKPSFWACILGHACQNNCFFVLLSWMPTYFTDTFPEVEGWIFNVVPWLFFLPCAYLGQTVSEGLIKSGYSITATRKIVETMCLMTQAIGLLFLAAATSSQGAITYLVFIIGSSGFHANAIAVNPSDLAPNHSGSVFGLMNTMGAIPGFLGVYVAGNILETTHSWSVVFLTTSAVNVFGCIMYLLFGSGKAVI